MRDTIYEFGIEGYAMSHTDCFLAAFSEVPCEGRMEKAHLIKQQTLRRELRSIMREESNACLMSEDDVRRMVWDPRIIVPACHRHHTMLDQSRTLRIPREAIPTGAEEYALEWGFMAWLEREYGPLERAA